MGKSRARRCWAASLEDCEGPLTGEHLISECTFREPTVKIDGLPWCKSSPQTIGVSSLTANILCRHHNEHLSPADEAGGRFLKAIAAINELERTRTKCGPARRWPVKLHRLDGPPLARWFLKTTINLAIANKGGIPIGAAKGEPDLPAPHLVETAFGHQPFEGHAGLWAGPVTGERSAAVDYKEFQTLTYLGDSGPSFVCAGLFIFAGMRFVLWLMPDRAPPDVGLVASGWEGARLFRPLNHLRFQQGKYLSQRLTLNW